MFTFAAAATAIFMSTSPFFMAAVITTAVITAAVITAAAIFISMAAVITGYWCW